MASREVCSALVSASSLWTCSGCSRESSAGTSFWWVRARSCSPHIVQDTMCSPSPLLSNTHSLSLSLSPPCFLTVARQPKNKPHLREPLVYMFTECVSLSFLIPSLFLLFLPHSCSIMCKHVQLKPTLRSFCCKCGRALLPYYSTYLHKCRETAG